LAAGPSIGGRRRVRTWLVLFALSASTLASADDGRYARGTLDHLRIFAPSLHGQLRSVRVYLPPSYRDPRAIERRYPLVVLLHGWPGGDGNWPGQGRATVTLDSMIAHRSIPEVIALMPNGNGPGMWGHSRYLDAFDHSFDIQEFLVRDLVEWADSTLRTRRDPSQRALVGLSDGGSSAINLTLLHPDVFGAAASLSGQYQLGKAWGESRILGPEPGASDRRRKNSPMEYVADRAGTARRQALFIACGLSDHELADNRAFHARLDSLGIPHRYVEAKGGHGWGFWSTQLPAALRAVTARMKTVN
jgi:S-formylglutathione hydrolase FrmB